MSQKIFQHALSLPRRSRHPCKEINAGQIEELIARIVQSDAIFLAGAADPV